MLQARLLAYQDAHRHRIGGNANQIPVNAPRSPVLHYQRDGAMAGQCPVRGGSDNQDGSVNFYPNDRAGEGAPMPQPGLARPPLPVMEQAWIRAYDTEDDDHCSQAGELFRLMGDERRRQLAHNIAEGLVQAIRVGAHAEAIFPGGSRSCAAGIGGDGVQGVRFQGVAISLEHARRPHSGR
jgi:catalase